MDITTLIIIGIVILAAIIILPRLGGCLVRLLLVGLIIAAVIYLIWRFLLQGTGV